MPTATGSRARWVLAAYVVALLLLVVAPVGWALNRLTVRLYVLFRYDVPIAPDAALPEHYGVLLNVVLFVPLGWGLVRVAGRSWWVALVVLGCASGAIELAQGLLEREPSWVDVVSNCVGGLAGALAATLTSVLSDAVRRRG